MNLHEYQSKRLFAEAGIPVPAGEPAMSPEEAVSRARSLGGDAWMVKAQVHAGGRGKAGGIGMATSLDEVRAIADRLLGTRLVTRQSGPRGQPVRCVLVEATTDISQELYLGMVIDRARRRVAIMASRAGGMDIEEIAASRPQAVHRASIDPVAGLQPYQGRQLGFALGLDATQRRQLAGILDALYRLFIDKDLGLAEINPLVITADGDLLALDAKINLDDNALYRHPDLLALRDISQEDEKEAAAREHDLNYITLDGDIGCMVNGAGLAMATMDIIKLHGGRPANFLDVGGGTTAERVTEAFRLIVSGEGVRAILVNIFGGIVRCDLIARGIITAMQQAGLDMPVVVRLEGTNVEQGREMLEHSGLDIIAVTDLSDAAKRAVGAARGG